MGLTAAVAAAATAAAVACRPVAPGTRLRALRSDPRLGRRHLVAGLGLAQVAVVLLGVPLVGGGALAGAVAVVLLLRRRRVRQLRRMRQDATVELVLALAAELRAGRTPGQALDSAAQHIPILAAPLMAAGRAVRAGVPAAEPLHAVSLLDGCEALAAVAAVWHVTERVGGAVADVLDRLGAALDADAADRRGFEAALAGPRASMALLAGLPVVGLVMAQSAGAHPLRLLLHRPLGWALLGAAAALELVGLAWSRRLVRGVLPA